MNSLDDMRTAYRDMASPSMLALSAWIVILLAFLFDGFNATNIKHTLEWPRRIGFYVLVGANDLAICYSGAILALYLARSGSRLHVVIALSASAPILGVPCSFVFFAGYALFHDGHLPPAGIVEIYAVTTLNALWAGALVVWVLFLRLHRRHLLSMKERDTARDPVCEANSGDEANAPGRSVRHVQYPDGGDTNVANSPRPAPSDVDQDDGTVEELARNQSSTQSGRLLERLPTTIGTDVVYVHVSGHYLEVVTTSGSALVLMRLSDAVTALGDRGMQVHRSYWVSYDHVTRLKRQDHRMILCLSGDLEIPVSRPFLPRVRGVVRTARNQPAIVRPSKDGGPAAGAEGRRREDVSQVCSLGARSSRASWASGNSGS